MNMKKRTNQGGSSVAYVVIGIMLTISMAGLMYYIVQKGQAVRKEQAIAVYEDENQDKEKEVLTPQIEVGLGDEASNDSDKTSDNAAAQIEVTDDLPVSGLEIDVNQILATGMISTTLSSYFISRKNRA